MLSDYTEHTGDMLSSLLVQCTRQLSHITLLDRVNGQRRMVEISKSGATGGGRVYGPRID
jgi:hypothetical protein